MKTAKAILVGTSADKVTIHNEQALRVGRSVRKETLWMIGMRLSSGGLVVSCTSTWSFGFMGRLVLTQFCAQTKKVGICQVMT
jgi:hypothetical protein